MRGVPWIASLLCVGCCFGGGEEPAPTPPPASEVVGELVAPRSDGAFVFATAHRTYGAEPPARLTAPIPTSLAGLRAWPETSPPRAQYEARLCGGETRAIDEWLAASASAAGAASPAAVAVAYASLTRDCAGAICASLRARVGTPLEPGARETALLALARCREPEDEARMLADDAPAMATVTWMVGEWFAPPPSPERAPRLLRALEAHLAAVSPTPDDANELCGGEVYRAIQALVRTGPITPLVALHGRLSGAPADCVANGLASSSDPRARRIFDAACPRLRSPERCARRQDAVVGEAVEEPPRTIDEEVRAFDFVTADVPVERRAAILEALGACVDGAGADASHCLRVLASMDRPRAVQHARAWLAAHPDAGEQSEAARGLDRFPEPGALASYLRELGLVGPEESLRDDPRAVSPLDVLMTTSHLAVFDTETDRFPNEHDALLVELSLLAPDALPGVLFAEELREGESPGGAVAGGTEDDGTFDGEDEPMGEYHLFAYAGRARYEVVAADYDDWYDVDSVIGLLDTLALERRSSVRWLALATEDQMGMVVAGPEAGLRRAIADGWLVPAPHDAVASPDADEEDAYEEGYEEGYEEEE